MFGSRIRSFIFDILLNKKREAFVLINKVKKKSNTVTVKKKERKKETKGTKPSTKKCR